MTIREFGYSVRLKISNIVSSSFCSPLKRLSNSSINKNIGFLSFSCVIIYFKSFNFSLKTLGTTSVSCFRIKSKIVLGVLNVIALSSITIGLLNFLSFALKNFYGLSLMFLSIYVISKVFPPPGVPDIKRF